MTLTRKAREECILFLLSKAYQKGHGEFKKLLKPHGLTNIQHLVLEGLMYEPGATAVELGKALILDKATLSGVVNRLLEGGWIEKVGDESDSRAQKLFLAEGAKNTVEQIVESRRGFDDQFLSEISGEEKILLKRLLHDLVW
jgi:DNA-binding MarR family transcriptional regulator